MANHRDAWHIRTMLGGAGLRKKPGTSALCAEPGCCCTSRGSLDRCGGSTRIWPGVRRGGQTCSGGKLSMVAAAAGHPPEHGGGPGAASGSTATQTRRDSWLQSAACNGCTKLPIEPHGTASQRSSHPTEGGEASRPAHEAQADSRVTPCPTATRRHDGAAPTRHRTHYHNTATHRKKEDRSVTDKHAVQPVVTANMACYMSALQKGISAAAVPAQRTQRVRHCSH